MGGSNKRYASLGDIVIVAVKEAFRRDSEEGRGARAVVVRTVKEVGRQDGSYIRFDRNARRPPQDGRTTPVGTRISGRWPASCGTGSSRRYFLLPRSDLRDTPMAMRTCAGETRWWCGGQGPRQRGKVLRVVPGKGRVVVEKST